MRKSATLTGIVISMVLAIGIFIGLFTWLNTNASDSGVPIDPMYSNVQSNLSTKSTDLKRYFDDTKNNLTGVVEAENIYYAAINGFKGVGKILLSPVVILDYALMSWANIRILIEFPDWARMLVEVAILAVIVLLIVAIVKGEQYKM
jgi:Mg2+/citrate symporter